VPVPVGKTVEYAIELREMCMTFRKGHRMVLEIRAQDSSAEEPIWYHQTNAVATRHGIQCGGKRPSYLLLPVIPALKRPGAGVPGPESAPRGR
jgi:predicted acyl esterase